jgi:type IV pilus assembly protein PilM
MAGKTIGIEIGNDSVKLAVVSGGRVQKVAAEHLPENMVLEGNVTSPDAMSSFIRKMRKEHHIPGGNCALVLPYRSVITNSVTLPPMSDGELKMNLPFEFRDYVGADGAKYHYDYAVMDVVNGPTGQAEKVEVFAAAVRQDLINKSYDMLKKAGLTMKVALPQEMAWLNLVRKATEEPNEICIVDVGHTATRVFLYADGKFVMGRELEIGGQLLDEAIASSLKLDVHIARSYKENNLNGVWSSAVCADGYNALAVEIMKVVNFYANFSGRETKLNDIYFCGGQSTVEGLRTAVRKATGLTAHHICRLVPGGWEDQETLTTALAAAAAIG